jgi:hypothetical protein
MHHWYGVMKSIKDSTYYLYDLLPQINQPQCAKPVKNSIHSERGTKRTEMRGVSRSFGG